MSNASHIDGVRSGNSHVGTLFVLSLWAALVGCAATPKVDSLQFGQIEARMVAASEQKAEHYAPVELRIAQEQLAQARIYSEGRKHADAARALELAGLQADLARLKSETAQMRERVSVAENENDQLRSELLPDGAQ